MSKNTKRAQSLFSFVSKPGVYIVEYQHDRWCKTISTQRLEDCTCTPHIVKKKMK